MDIPFLEHVCNALAPDARSVRANAALVPPKTTILGGMDL